MVLSGNSQSASWRLIIISFFLQPSHHPLIWVDILPNWYIISNGNYWLYTADLLALNWSQPHKRVWKREVRDGLLLTGAQQRYRIRRGSGIRDGERKVEEKED